MKYARYITYVFLAVISLGAYSPVASANTTCVSLSSTLSYGMNGSQVTSLQTYLKGAGYLSAVINGHFGPATVTAVKNFQIVNGITQTGQVGPLTRAKIAQKTCPVGTATAMVVAPVNTPVSNPAPVNIPIQAPVSLISITSPATGQVLAMGSSTVIRWNTTPPNVFDISLEQPGGAGAGFVATGQSSSATGNQYVWSVGKVFSSQSNTNITIPTGTYRIRIQSPSTGASSSDAVSGWFTIVGQQFTVTSVNPSSSYADNTTSVALFGTGLTSGTSIYFDSNFSGARATNTYTSPDGTILVFTVPTSITTGSHTLFINNGLSATPVTMPFTVLSIQ